MTKTQCIGQLAHRCGEIRYNNTTITEKTRRNNAASTHSHDTHIRCAMSEGPGAEASSETSGSVAAAATAAATAAPAAAPAAGPLAAGEAIDELLAANDDNESSKKRKYPEPSVAVERTGPAGGRGSYTIAFKRKAAAFMMVGCAHGKSVGNHEFSV